MALGVWPIAIWITDEDGTVIRVESTESRIRVTDVPSEVHTSGVIGIEAKGVLAGIEDLPERYTDADVVAKLREILRAGGAAVRTLLVCAALLGAALLNAATVQTAPKQAIYNDQQIVTNVTFEGLAMLDDLPDMSNYVPTTRLVAGKPLTSNVTLGPADVGALPADGTAREAETAHYAYSAEYANYTYYADRASDASFAEEARSVNWSNVSGRPQNIVTFDTTDEEKLDTAEKIVARAKSGIEVKVSYLIEDRGTGFSYLIVATNGVLFAEKVEIVQ